MSQLLIQCSLVFIVKYEKDFNFNHLGFMLRGVSFILALHQWGKFSSGKNCLIENAI